MAIEKPNLRIWLENAKHKREMLENELNERLKKVKRFAGSYTADELRDVELKLFPIFLAVNLNKLDSPGCRWIALAIYTNSIYVCDSLGDIKPDSKASKGLINFLDLISNDREFYITKQLQSDTSDMCGEYCVLFINQMAETNSLHQFISLFTSDMIKNDQIVKFLTKSYKI